MKIAIASALFAVALAGCGSTELSNEPMVRLVTPEAHLPLVCETTQDIDIEILKVIFQAEPLSDLEGSFLKRHIEERLRSIPIQSTADQSCSEKSALDAAGALRLAVSFKAYDRVSDYGQLFRNPNFAIVVSDCAPGYFWFATVEVRGELVASMEVSLGQCDQKAADLYIAFDQNWFLGHRTEAIAMGATLISLAIQSLGSDLKLKSRREASPQPLDSLYLGHAGGIVARKLTIKIKTP
ncbi:hypothetical protein [Dongia sp.]|uniref:hypothetical protein n=1 Tax=Dongia sp. TaxID=1977262 RepID=UPI003751E8C9